MRTLQDIRAEHIQKSYKNSFIVKAGQAIGHTKSEQQSKVKKVMDEWKSGTLKSSSGQKVTERKQALAIAISEAKRLEKGIDDTDYIEASFQKSKEIISLNPRERRRQLLILSKLPAC